MKTWNEILAMHGLMADCELEWLRDSAYGNCVELGSLEGKSACATAFGVGPKGGHVTCFDIWSDPIRKPAFDRNVQGMPITGIPGDSVQAAGRFKNSSVDFLFIDTSHQFEQTVNEIQAWYPKVKPGGLIAGHDYRNDGYPGVEQAVRHCCPEHSVAPGTSIWYHIKPVSVLARDPSLLSFDPVGKWRHADQPQPMRYGIQESYEAAACFLDGLPVVEDWGCGTGYARRFFKQSKYLGVDGSSSQFCDAVDDLRTRRSEPDGILMRHVLEHNPCWEQVLDNALASFRQRMVLIMFLEFAESTQIFPNPYDHIPCIRFRREDITCRFEPFLWKQQSVDSDTVFYLQRLPS